MVLKPILDCFNFGKSIFLQCNHISCIKDTFVWQMTDFAIKLFNCMWFLFAFNFWEKLLSQSNHDLTVLVFLAGSSHTFIFF